MYVLSVSHRPLYESQPSIDSCGFAGEMRIEIFGGFDCDSPKTISSASTRNGVPSVTPMLLSVTVMGPAALGYWKDPLASHAAYAICASPFRAERSATGCT